MYTRGVWKITHPWAHEACDNGAAVIFVGKDPQDANEHIATVRGGLKRDKDDTEFLESQANARLLRAAPGLYEELLSVCTLMQLLLEQGRIHTDGDEKLIHRVLGNADATLDAASKQAPDGAVVEYGPLPG